MRPCKFAGAGSPHLSPPGPPLFFVWKANVKVDLLIEGSNSFPPETCHLNLSLKTDQKFSKPRPKEMAGEQERLVVSLLDVGCHPRPGLPSQEVSDRHGEGPGGLLILQSGCTSVGCAIEDGQSPPLRWERWARRLG